MSDSGLCINVQSTSGLNHVNVPYDSTILWLDHMEIVDVDLSQVKKLSNLERVHLNNNKLRTLDLTPLRNCKKLQWIILSHNSLEDIDLRPVADMSKLTNLELGSNELTKVDLSALRKHPSLSTLILSNNRIETIDLGPLKQCKNLSRLYLLGNRLTELSLAPFAGHQKLEYLDISRNSLKELDLSPLENNDCLASLYFSENELERIDLPSFQHEWPAILALSDNRLEEINLTPMRKCIKLSELDLSGNSLNRIDLAPLSTLGTLQHLILLDNPLEFVDLTPLLYILVMHFSISGAKSRKLREYTDLDELYMGRSTKPLEFGSGSIIFTTYASKGLNLYIDDNIPVFIDNTLKAQLEKQIGRPERIEWADQPSLIKKSATKGWAQLVSLLETFPLDAVYSALCMNELRGFGCEIMTLAKSISDDASYEEGRLKLYAAVVKALESKLIPNFSTKRLDIDTMMNTEASRLVPIITKLRKLEVESLSLEMDGEKVDTRPLRATYYGALLFDDIKPYKVDRGTFVRIKDRLVELEINLENPKGW